jgi:hypothetical protein
MSGTTERRQDFGEQLITRPVPAAPAHDRVGQRLAWLAAAGIICSVLVMIAVAAIRNAWERPRIPIPAGGLPWALSAHVSLALVSWVMWGAALLAGASVAAGLIALNRGARLPVRLLLGVGIVAAAVFTVLPPTGSTDALDYASYGRITLLGHNPYIMTPYQLRLHGDPVARYEPNTWARHVSVYGPLATGEQWAAASLGGTSMARITFWLKLWNAFAFGAVVLALERMLRSDPARRARAHLLWTANPLLLWILVAAGHLDLMAVALGFLGLMVLRKRDPADEPGALRGLAAGVLVAAAGDVKINYLLFGLGVVWAARRSRAALLCAAAGAALVLVPSYLSFGYAAVKALIARNYLASVDNFYQLFAGSHGHHVPGEFAISVVAFAGLVVLMLWRLPDGAPALPAVRPALAVSVAWVFTWSYQLPWYDSMVICLLAVYPASRLDWLVLARVTLPTFALMPGNAGWPREHVLHVITIDSIYYAAPLVLLAALVAVVVIGLGDWWNMGPPLTRCPSLASVAP